MPITLRLTGTMLVGAGLLLAALGAEPTSETAGRSPTAAPTVEPRGRVKVWEKYRTAALQARQRHNYQEAHRNYVAALQEAEGFGAKDLRWAESLDDLGSFLVEFRDYEIAESFFQRALDLRERAVGTNHVEVAYFLMRLGEVYGYEKMYGEARQAYRRAQGIYERKLGAFHPAVGQCLAGLATVYLMQEKYPEAEPLFKQALAILESPQSHATFNASGQVQRWVRRPRPHEIAGVLNNQALLYTRQGKWDAAVPVFERSLKLSEQDYGKDSAHLVIPLNNLARADVQRQRYDRAEAGLKRSLAILQKAAGSNHPVMIETLGLLAGVYQAQGNTNAAAGAAKRLNEIRARAAPRSN